MLLTLKMLTATRNQQALEEFLDEYITDPTAIDAFNETRVGIQDRIRAEMEAKRKAEDRARLLAIRQSMVGVESHPLYLTFFPFGVGQFQNEDRAKGVFFAATEAATLITSASIWGYLVNTYGIRSTRVPLESAQRVRSLQQLEIGTGFAFAARTSASCSSSSTCCRR